MKVKPEPARLTPRLKEVARLIALGYHNKEIASVLGMSCKTAEKHRAACYHVLKANDILSLTRAVLKAGLVSFEEWMAFDHRTIPGHVETKHRQYEKQKQARAARRSAGAHPPASAR
jgi:DNA-binding CsgD family transcriptional regulator